MHLKNKKTAPAYTMAPKREIFSRLTRNTAKVFTPIKLSKHR